MSSAADLLARLDAALAAAVTQAATGWHARELREAGIAAAAGLHAALVGHGLGWHDVTAPDSRLAKLCGRLGSEFPAEREAAYDHTVRLILLMQTSWSAAIRLPEALRPKPPALAASMPSPPLSALARPQTPVSHAVSPPEADWMMTVQLLKARGAWRSVPERTLLDTVETRLANGESITRGTAKWLRDMWWTAELNAPVAGGPCA